jgi:hypothetical protein
MASAKSPYQDFQVAWTKTVNWAHSQGISNAAIIPVYQMDSARVVQGEYTMSEAERTRAILAAENPNNVTPLPSDKPAGGVFGFFTNLEHDASNIFTGLQPTHMVTSIFDSVKNTVQHPGWLFNPTKNTLAQMIPGVSLIGEYEQGGMDNLAAHPLITFLNLLGIASAGVGAIAHTALGDTLASAINVGSREALAQMGPTGIATKIIGNIPTRTAGLMRDAETGLPVMRTLTVSEKLNKWANVKGIGPQIADLNSIVHHSAQAATARLETISTPDLENIIANGTKANAAMFDKSLTIDNRHLADLTGVPVGSELDYVHAAFNMAVFSGKSWADLASEASIPVEM